MNQCWIINWTLKNKIHWHLKAQSISVKKIHFKMLPVKCLPLCSSLKVLTHYTPCSMKLKGVYWFPLVHPSVCQSVHLSVCAQNRVCSVPSIILARSISYLHIFSSNFRRCVTCKVFFSKFSFVKFFKFVTLTLSCVDLGSNMNWSIVWVIMGWRGYPQNTDVLVGLVPLVKTWMGNYVP